MKEEYFVVLNCQNGSMLILVDETGDPAIYESEEQARGDAMINPLGEAFGFEVFRRGDGL